MGISMEILKEGISSFSRSWSYCIGMRNLFLHFFAKKLEFSWRIEGYMKSSDHWIWFDQVLDSQEFSYLFYQKDSKIYVLLNH